MVVRGWRLGALLLEEPEEPEEPEELEARKRKKGKGNFPPDPLCYPRSPISLLVPSP